MEHPMRKKRRPNTAIISRAAKFKQSEREIEEQIERNRQSLEALRRLHGKSPQRSPRS